MWRALVTDYMAIDPLLPLPAKYICRGDDEYVIICSIDSQHHVMMLRTDVTEEGWKAALNNLEKGK